MTEIKGFSFYKSYYESLDGLEKNDKYELLEAMLDYVFKNKKPKFNGLKKSIWALIEPNLNTSKNRSNTKAGAPEGNQNARKHGENKGENNTIKKQSKNNQKSINHLKDISLSLSLSYSLSSSLSLLNNSIINNNKLLELFIEYLKVREENNYTLNEIVISRLLKKLDQAGTDEEKQEMIEQAIIKKWKEFYLTENVDEDISYTKLENGGYEL